MDRFPTTDSPVILIYSRSPTALRDWLHAAGCPGTLLTASTPDEAARLIAATEAILSWRFPAGLYARAGRLRWVQSMGAGVDDIVAAAELAPDVVVTRIVDQFGGYIAEYVFAELLARVRQLDRLRRGQRERRWEHFIASTLAGRTLGVAGIGSIGREVVRKGRAFDLGIHGLSRSAARAGLVDRHFRPDQWVEFARDLDYLVLTLPHTTSTERVVDERVLNALRPDAILINVGRGALIDEPALVTALREGRLAGAILDVFQQEPLPAESPLWDLPNVTVTPHISGPSTVEGVGAFFLENVQRFLRDEVLVGVVDRGSGY